MIAQFENRQRRIAGVILAATAGVAAAAWAGGPEPHQWQHAYECRVQQAKCGHQDTPHCCTGTGDCYYCPSGEQRACDNTNNPAYDCRSTVGDPPPRCNYFKQGVCFYDASDEICPVTPPEISKVCGDWVNVIPLYCDKSSCEQRNCTHP